MDPTRDAAELDESVGELLREAGAATPAPSDSQPAGNGGTGPGPAASPPTPARPASAEPSSGALVGAAVSHSRVEEPVREAPARPTGASASLSPPAKPAANDSDFADAEAILGSVQADLQGTAPSAPPAPAATPAGPAKSIQDLDAALEGKAAAVLQSDAPDTPTLARAVAANLTAPAAPAPVASAPAKPAASPSPKAAPAEPAPAEAAVLAPTPARAPSRLRIALGQLATRIDRLPPPKRQLLSWAAYVTFVSAAALWTVVLVRSPVAAKSQADGHPADSAHEGESAPAPEPAAEPSSGSREKPAKPKDAKPKPKDAHAAAKKPAGKTASAAGHH